MREPAAPHYQIIPRASARVASMLGGVHLAVMASLLLIPDWSWLQLSCAMVVLTSLVWNWRLHVTRSVASAITVVQWDGVQDWTLTSRDGKSVCARLSGDSLIQPGLLILNFRFGRWNRRSLILTPDAIDHDLLRRLRVGLRA